MLDSALSKILEQGVTGALLVILLLAIGYLQRKRDSDAEARLKEARETLVTAAETNRVLSGIKDTLGGVAQSLNFLTVTVQTIDGNARSALASQTDRDQRVERMIEANGDVIRDIQAAAERNKGLIERAVSALEGRGR
ncbi:hypothetical protein [Methylobacterium sp. WSM2598]|uniref:hypothetical protein n=1 Tax=Methylobacterium sp. WSM2598 TaxID=398261 RepID=UPI0003618862|nr:hypothetical protein [Methylobacterium sp. WSM2598]